MNYHTVWIIFSNAKIYIILHKLLCFLSTFLDNFHPSTCFTMLSPRKNIIFFIFTSRGFLFDRTGSEFCVTVVSWSFSSYISRFVYTWPLLCVLFSESKLLLIILVIKSFFYRWFSNRTFTISVLFLFFFLW